MGNAKFFSCLPFLAMANCLPSCWPLLLRRWLQKSCKLIGENSRNLDRNTKTERQQQMEHFGNGWTPIAGLSIKWPKMAPINCGPCIKCDYFFFFFRFWTEQRGCGTYRTINIHFTMQLTEICGNNKRLSMANWNLCSQTASTPFRPNKISIHLSQNVSNWVWRQQRHLSQF